MGTVIVTGASSGFGALATRALGRRGHPVYTGIREVEGRNAPAVADLAGDAKEAGLDLRPLELDVTDDTSVDDAVGTVIADQAVSMSSCTTPGTWSSVPSRRSRLGRWPIPTT